MRRVQRGGHPPGSRLSRPAVLLACAPVDLKEGHLARCLHEVYALAHAQESRLLAPSAEPSQPWSAEQFQCSGLFCLGALRGEAWVGAVCIGPDDDSNQLSIALLFVHPAHQRQGIARQLLHDLLTRSQGMVLSVAVAAANKPALALYASLGFVGYRHGTIGAGEVPMLKLRR